MSLELGGDLLTTTNTEFKQNNLHRDNWQEHSRYKIVRGTNWKNMFITTQFWENDIVAHMTFNDSGKHMAMYPQSN